MEWTGEDRRKSSSSLIQDIETLAQEFREFRVESRKYRTDTQRDIACMKEGFEVFRAKYQTHLDQQLASELYWATLRKDTMSSIVKSAVMAALVAVGVIIALGGKSWLIGWLATP